MDEDLLLWPIYGLESSDLSIWKKFEKKVFFWGGHYGTIPYNEVSTLRELYTNIGKNIGNLLYLRAIARQIGNNTIGRPSLEYDSYDIMIFSPANMIRENFKVPDSYFSTLKKIKLPCCVIGIGAQSKEKCKLSLKQDMIRFLKILSERSVTMGVRGEYTAEVLESYGIKNSHIIGCPSLFYHCTQKLKNKISVPERIINPIFQWTAYVQGEFQLLREAFIADIPVIESSFLPFMELAMGKCSSIGWNACKFILNKLNLFKNYDDKHKYLYLRKILHTFFDVEDWFAFLRKHDFLVTTRIHGAIASVLCGVPVLLLTHDTRTEELAKFLGIPNIPLDTVEHLDYKHLSLKADFTHFHDNYIKLYANYYSFLKENNVPSILQKPYNFYDIRHNF